MLTKCLGRENKERFLRFAPESSCRLLN